MTILFVYISLNFIASKLRTTYCKFTFLILFFSYFNFILPDHKTCAAVRRTQKYFISSLGRFGCQVVNAIHFIFIRDFFFIIYVLKSN